MQLPTQRQTRWNEEEGVEGREGDVGIEYVWLCCAWAFHEDISSIITTTATARVIRRGEESGI